MASSYHIRLCAICCAIAKPMTKESNESRYSLGQCINPLYPASQSCFIPGRRWLVDKTEKNHVTWDSDPQRHLGDKLSRTWSLAFLALLWWHLTHLLTSAGDKWTPRVGSRQQGTLFTQAFAAAWVNRNSTYLRTLPSSFLFLPSS